MLRDNTSALVICVESAALYAICAVIYIPLFAINTPIQYPFSALLGGVVVSVATDCSLKTTYLMKHPQSISPTLIMLRMASGIAINGKWGDIALRDIDQDAAVGDLDRDSKLTMDSVQV